jgi:ubiquinone/menaquinone biosynthesis C-methylase UbiE
MTPSLSEEDVARHWDAIADQWADHVRRGWDVFRDRLNNPAFFELLGDVRGELVLDAGCGEGYNTRLLAKSGARVTGFDISPRMIELAREEEGREPLGVRYEAASFSDLPAFQDESFDVVVSTMALMDGPDFDDALREFRRILKPGGDFLFSITHPCFMTKGFGWLDGADGNRAKLLVSDYFEAPPWVERWRFQSAPEDEALFAIPVFPRTLSDYVNGLINAGFVLREIHEPRPSEEACRAYPFLRPWRDHAALFLHVHATKGAN